ncbi:hypothetical protein POM88_012379 [Heracleum sosnowskyi]|uniref:Uncharacterized protein n=1 Tax=Heracleum sosnowskyi TaxID=360622 RepID=A0AAD8IXZ0_9APIA|nr:hypothetical protein POM88_012379 [Heracleum sosnowskyi]
MFEGLKRAYWDGFDVLELETYNLAAEWEWTNSMMNGIPHEHAYVIQQLNQRKADDNLSLEVKGVDTDSNVMAHYLARVGAERWKKMVIIENIFGIIEEIWSSDMGLGPIEDQFVAVYKSYIADGEVVNSNAGIEMDQDGNAELVEGI